MVALVASANAGVEELFRANPALMTPGLHPGLGDYIRRETNIPPNFIVTDPLRGFVKLNGQLIDRGYVWLGSSDWENRQGHEHYADKEAAIKEAKSLGAEVVVYTIGFRIGDEGEYHISHHLFFYSPKINITKPGN
jgi:hypothetical protein